MEWRTAYLDALLVPTGLLILLTYQACLVRRVKHKPLGTVIGVNHLARRQWVYSMMKVQQLLAPYTYVLLLFHVISKAKVDVVIQKSGHFS
jgi:hypothetical protein